MWRKVTEKEKNTTFFGANKFDMNLCWKHK